MAQRKVSEQHTEQFATPALAIERTFDAPRSLVYQMWSKPDHLSKWSAPKGFTIPAARTDFREGGRWYARMLATDGADYRVQGKYIEIVEGKRIVLTHAWLDGSGAPGRETLITIDLEDTGRQTKMSFLQEGFESVESRNGMAVGWNECFDQLEQQLLHTAGPS